MNSLISQPLRDGTFMLRIGGQRSVLSGLDSFGEGAMNLRDTADCHDNAMNHGKHKSLRCSLIRFPVISSAQIEGDDCVDSNAKSNSDSIDEILNRVNQ